MSILIASDSTLLFHRAKKSFKGQVKSALYEDVHGVKEVTTAGSCLATLRGVMIDNVFTKTDPDFEYHVFDQDFKVAILVSNF